MKKIILAALLVCSAFTHARQVTIDLPELTTEDEVFFNFDGSITIINPKVFVRGEYYKVTNVLGGTAIGLCVVYNRTKAVAVSQVKEYQRQAEEGTPVVVKISPEGSFSGFAKIGPNDWQYWIEEITCK